jgi:hypothetical protein
MFGRTGRQPAGGGDDCKASTPRKSNVMVRRAKAELKSGMLESGAS